MQLNKKETGRVSKHRRVTFEKEDRKDHKDHEVIIEPIPDDLVERSKKDLEDMLKNIESVERNICVKCKGDTVGKDSYIIFPSCDHSAHVSCTSSKKSCPVCKPTKVKGMVSIDHGTDPLYTRYLEQKYGLQGIVGVNEYEEVKDLTSNQKYLIHPKYSVLFGSSDIEISKSVLIENNIKIDALIEADVTIKQMYYKIGLVDLQDLIDVGFKKEHLKCINIKKFSSLYKVDRTDLQDKIGLVLKDMIDWNVTIRDLASIGWKYSDMEYIGIPISNLMKLFKQNNAPKRLVFYLSMKKSDLFRLNLKWSTLHSCGWDANQTIKWFKLDSLDKSRLKMIENQSVAKFIEFEMDRH